MAPGQEYEPRHRLFGWLGQSSDPDFREEVEKILSQMEEGVEKPRPKILFEVGEMVRVKEGPFADFNGNVEEVNYEKSKVRVSVTILVAPRPSNSISARSKRPDINPGEPRSVWSGAI